MNNGVKFALDNCEKTLKLINEIESTFKCSNMGEMRRSSLINSLVLIVKHVNPLYDD